MALVKLSNFLCNSLFYPYTDSLSRAAKNLKLAYTFGDTETVGKFLGILKLQFYHSFNFYQGSAEVVDIASDEESGSDFNPNEGGESDEEDDDTLQGPSNDPWLNDDDDSEELQPKVNDHYLPPFFPVFYDDSLGSHEKSLNTMSA